MTPPAEPLVDSPRAALPAPAEKPVAGMAKFAVIASAGVAVALFYVVALLIALLLGLWIGCELLVAAVAARFGAVGFITPYLERHTRLLLLFFKAAWLRKGTEFRVPLTEPDAPRLFAFLRELSGRFSVPPPREVLIEMNASAWVMLKGVRRGADATTLGMGYDLIAGLTQAELEAVLAHEMAHAKFVRRGYKRLINSGSARALNLTGQVAGMVEAYRRAQQEFAIGEWVLGTFNRLARMVVRLVARYSRQDEFEADAGASRVCGPAPLRSSLIKLDHIVEKTSRISWAERAAHLQQGSGFTSWLANELGHGAQVAPAQPSLFDCYSTHPSLADRLAALGSDDAPPAPSRPAIELFADPDALGKRLVTEIHRVVAAEETASTRAELKWLRKLRRKNERATRRRVGVFFLVLGLLAVAAWLSHRDPDWLWLIGIFLAVGATTWHFGRYRGTGALPVPTYEAFHASWESDEDDAAREAREKVIAAEVESLAAESNPKRKRAALLSTAVDALTRCDYLRAAIAGRRLLELDNNNSEVVILAAIGFAGLGNGPVAGDLLGNVVRRTGLPTQNLLWGAAWTLCLLGQWAEAEPMLEMLCRSDHGQATYGALLALCQSNRGKLQSATLNARRSLEALPSSKVRRELACDLLIRAGHLGEAERLLRDAGATAESEPGLIESQVWLSVLRRDFAKAARAVEQLRETGISGSSHVSLGAIFETARQDERARDFYAAALEQGYYPAAELGLARLAAHRGDKDAARTHALRALNTARPLARKAASPASLLGPVIGLLCDLELAISDSTAWICVLDPHRNFGPLSRHKLLVFARTEASARAHVLEIIGAFNPGEPSLLPASVQVQKAPSDRQPIGVVRCGIQSYWV